MHPLAVSWVEGAEEGRLLLPTDNADQKKRTPPFPAAFGSARSAHSACCLFSFVWSARCTSWVMLACIAAPVTNKPGKVPRRVSPRLLTQLSGGGSGASQIAGPLSPQPVHSCPETLCSAVMCDLECRPGTLGICIPVTNTKSVRGSDFLSLSDKTQLSWLVSSFQRH